MRSIVSGFGSEAFGRLRFGIGRPPAGWQGADYVLADFSAEERNILPNLIEEAADAAEVVVKDGGVAAMNRFNRKKKPKSETGGAT